MAGICTTSTSPGNCGHRTMTIVLDGTPITIHTDEGEALAPLTAQELETFIRLGVRRLRQKGVTLAQFLNRVIQGDEATNVKQYDFLGPGSTVTKTNIGTGYVNVMPGLNGERIPVDMTGATEFRIFLNVNHVGTGVLRAKVMRDGGNNLILYENTNINVAAGERELDTGWLAIPAGFDGVELLRWQMSSSVATDDPVFRRMGLLVR